MSYDFHLFLPKPGVDPLVTAQAELDEESDELNPGPPEPSKEARKKAITDALMRFDPSLEVFQFEFDEIARSQRISIDEAKLQFRHVELNGPEDGPGIQIMLLDDGAAVTVPYWHKDQKAKSVFGQIWDYLRVIQQVGRYEVYDPQMECIVNLDSDLEKATQCYTDVVNEVMAMSTPPRPGPAQAAALWFHRLFRR